MYTKFSPGLFLEKIELDRFRKSIDEKGFRQFLLDNTLKFGLINKQYFDENDTVINSFTNGKVYETAGLTLAYNEIRAFNSSGNFIYKTGETNISVPIGGWLWVKFKHIYTSKELGLFSIDENGNLTGTASSQLLSILRGQPYFPSKVRFLNSTLNTLEYDVLEVIDDQNAILQGYFTPESNLQLSVVGTFTPGFTPQTLDKDIFQYDDCEVTLVDESVFNTPPTKVDGEEFYLARVKNDGVDLIIQDKRVEFWQTRANFYLKNLDKTINALIGVERIRYDHPLSTKDKNLVEMSWGMRSSNWSVNSKLNQVTFSGGNGGRYKDVTYFNDGDFDGWRLYWPDGTYSRVLSSIKSGGQINLSLDLLDINKVSSDGGFTFNAVSLLVTPDAEEIEIEFTADPDNVIDETELVKSNFVFPINTEIGTCRLLSYLDPTCKYAVRYRYKHIDDYSQYNNIPIDTNFGYYTEKAFDDLGNLLTVVQLQSYSLNLSQGYIKLYSTNTIELTLKDDSYTKFVEKIDLGDVLGVETREILSGFSQYITQIGVNYQYQHYTSSSPLTLTLNNDKFIILEDGLRDGNKFYIHIDQSLVFSSFKLRIVQNFVSPTVYDLLKELTLDDQYYLNHPTSKGLFFIATWDEDNDTWLLSQMNESEPYGIWTEVVLDNTMTKTSSPGNNFTVSLIADPNNKMLKYKKIGKTVFLNFNIVGGNVSSSPISALAIKIPNNMLSSGQFTSIGHYRNNDQLLNPNTEPPGSAGLLYNGATYMYTNSTGVYFSTVGDSITITPVKDGHQNFQVSGANNIYLRGQIIFEIE